MGGKKMLLDILIEYSNRDLLELAQSRGIEIEYKTRGDLIGELLNLEEGNIAFALALVYRAFLTFCGHCRMLTLRDNIITSKTRAL